MAIGAIIGKVFGSSTIKDTVSTVLSGADEFFTSKEEKGKLENELTKILNEREIALQTNLLQETEAYLADVKNARDSNVAIQESDKASWISKNLPYMLDALFVIAFFIGLVMIMYKAVPQENKELFYTGFGLLGGYVSTVINYHRGTSSGSKASSDVLRHIVKNK